MWTLGSPVPDFVVQCTGGTVGPAALRGSWFVLLHCTEPAVHDCDACLARFDLLARALAERGCRLVVGIDAPGRALTERLALRAADGAGAAIVGRWATGVPPPAHAMRCALVDPGGVLRDFSERDRDAFGEWDVLDALARERCAAAPPAAQAAADTLGCVEWFDYRASGATRDPR